MYASGPALPQARPRRSRTMNRTKIVESKIDRFLERAAAGEPDTSVGTALAPDRPLRPDGGLTARTALERIEGG